MKFSKKILLLCLSMSSILPLVQHSNYVVNANADENKVTSIKEAIDKLINAKNYTIEVATKTGPLNLKYNIYFTEDGFYDDFLGDEYGYAAVDNKVFYFDLYNREFTASKPLKNNQGEELTSIWDNDLFYGFNRLRTNEFISAIDTHFSSSEKRVKNVFLNMFHVDFGLYPNVMPVQFSVDGDMNSFKFTFELTSGEKYDCKISNFGSTKIDVIDDYLASGQSYHTNDANLQKIIDLFANYNYTRLIYADDVDDYSIIAGKEIYDEKYFYTFFEDKYIASGYGYEIGMVGIDKTYGPITANGKEYGPYEFNGSYYCYLMKDENGEEYLQVMTSFPINEDSFVPNVYVYPTFLKAFEDSQYFANTGGGDFSFYTSKLDCIIDFINNFQMSETIAQIGAVPTGVYVEYYENGNPIYAGTENKETVVFRLEVSYFGAITTIPYVYIDFNKTSIPLINDENIDKYINSVIQGIIDKDVAKPVE